MKYEGNDDPETAVSETENAEANLRDVLEKIVDLIWEIVTICLISVWWRRDKEESEVTYLHYTAVTAPTDIVEENLVCACVRWFIPDKIHYTVCGK